MALFNANGAKDLLEKIERGVEIVKSIRTLEDAEIPLKVALELRVEEILSPMLRSETIRGSIEKILGRIEKQREERKRKRTEEGSPSGSAPKRAKKEDKENKAPKKTKKEETPLMKKAKQMAKWKLQQRR